MLHKPEVCLCVTYSVLCCNLLRSAHFAEGKALATEAHQIRLRAQAAHAEAARNIEGANNVGRGLGQNEIDLHGLHALEAVEALDRRYHFCITDVA